ncbi:MAG: YIP1 family protein [Chloroflexi bacterium]|nr:YIP1 family protein [Chloroflexota bacterium]
MNEMLMLYRGVLVLDSKTFADLKASPQVFRKGFLFVVVIGLIVGLVTGCVGMVGGLMTDPAKEIAQVRQQMRQQMGQFMPSGSDAAFLESFDMGMRIAERIVTTAKAPLPRQVETVFKQIGVIFSYPFNWLGSLILYGALVQIVATLLGGRGTIAQMLGLSFLTVAPHLIDALNVLVGQIPIAGGCIAFLISLIVLVWSVAIYIKGTATAHELSNDRAAVAVFAPILISAILAILILLTFGVLIAVANR